MGDPAEHPLRGVGGVIGAPLRDARVEIDELRVRSHEVGEQRQEQAAQEHEPEGDRQRETRGHLGVEPGVESSTEPAVMTDLPPDGFRQPQGWVTVRTALGDG